MGSYIASVSSFEAGLVSRLRAREEEAFRELFNRFQGTIYRTSLRILKEEESARDALQETFLNVYRAARHFRGDSRLGTWINRITVNVCLEIIRKSKKHSQRTDEDISQNVMLEDLRLVSPFHKSYQSELGSRVRRAMGRLSHKHYCVVQLYDLYGFTIPEIAGKLNLAEGTVKSRLFYGRQELKRLLAGQLTDRRKAACRI